MASIGWWKGSFDDPSDSFKFRVYNDKIYDTQYSASRSNSICFYTYMNPMGGSALQGSIVDDTFAFNLDDMHIAGTFKDPTHADVCFTNVPSPCAITSSKNYEAQWVDPKTP